MGPGIFEGQGKPLWKVLGAASQCYRWSGQASCVFLKSAHNRDHALVSCAQMGSRWVPQVCCLPVLYHGLEELLTVP